MPISMVVFGEDAFTQASMIRGIQRRPYVPSMLDSIIGFEPVAVTTDTVYITSRKRYLNLIRTTLRAAPIEMAAPDDKDARSLKIPRLAKGDKLFAHELANINPMEDETETDRAAAMVADKQDKLIMDLEATFENMRLGALRGLLLDTDGSTLVNYFTEFGIGAPADIDLTLDNLTLTVAQIRTQIANALVIPLAQASGAGNDPRFRLRAVCGSAFWFALTGHPAIEKAYEMQAVARERFNEMVWESFNFGGVEWFHYRGTDDGTAISVNTNKAHVFPVGVPSMWQHVMGPANEFMPLVNQPGRRYVPFMVEDKDRQQWVQPEIYSYPLFVNARPDLVLTVTV